MAEIPASLRAAGVVQVVAYALPLSRRFRGTTVREGMLLQGPSGWGEWAPFPEYADAAGATWLAAGLEAATGRWPDPVRAQVTANAIVPALPPHEAAEFALAAFRESGCTTIKVKVSEVGGSTVDDLERLTAVRDALPGHVRLRADANGAWTVDTALSAMWLFADLDLEYIEQPCASLDECAALRAKRPPGKIAVDEGLRLALDPASRRTRDDVRRAADVVVVKAAPLGGVGAALAIAIGLDIPVVVSGALDSSVGLAAGIALAAALPEQPYAAGLATGRLLTYDVTATPVVPRHGQLHVERYAPDPAALAVSAMAPDRQVWWEARLERCAALLADRGAAGAPDRAGDTIVLPPPRTVVLPTDDPAHTSPPRPSGSADAARWSV
ncbi:MAG: o-succinylbenzoate synthase [Candidatus Nanopelagicales bacterium]